MLVKRFVPPPVMNTAVSQSAIRSAGTRSRATQKRFVSDFPPDTVYRGEMKVEEYLEKLLRRADQDR